MTNFDHALNVFKKSPVCGKKAIKSIAINDFFSFSAHIYNVEGKSGTEVVRILNVSFPFEKVRTILNLKFFVAKL